MDLDLYPCANVRVPDGFVCRTLARFHGQPLPL